MAKIRLTWDEFFEARENESVKDELIDVDDHGDSSYELVIKRDGRFYSTTYLVIKEDGVMTDWPSDGPEFVEVRPVEKTIVVYEPVES